MKEVKNNPIRNIVKKKILFLTCLTSLCSTHLLGSRGTTPPHLPGRQATGNGFSSHNPAIDVYEALGVYEHTDPQKIQEAYEQKSSFYSLNRELTDQEKAKVIHIRVAFAILSDPQKKKVCDDFMDMMHRKAVSPLQNLPADDYLDAGGDYALRYAEHYNQHRSSHKPKVTLANDQNIEREFKTLLETEQNKQQDVFYKKDYQPHEKEERLAAATFTRNLWITGGIATACLSILLYHRFYGQKKKPVRTGVAAL